ncbi:MAG: hypothetical protein KatS3mg111_1489 [Pirellulaceae bacterium]|nr:MAG: hypothetical protein KatS3mg111_1489 [Pirellulaceae bacterium]
MRSDEWNLRFRLIETEFGPIDDLHNWTNVDEGIERRSVKALQFRVKSGASAQTVVIVHCWVSC